MSDAFDCRFVFENELNVKTHKFWEQDANQAQQDENRENSEIFEKFRYGFFLIEFLDCDDGSEGYVVEEAGYGEEDGEHGVEEEENEVFSVMKPDAVIYPGAVVVHV